MLLRTTRAALILGILLAATTVIAGCGDDASSTLKRPIGGYHYNGITDDNHMMTFAAYGLASPLFEAKFSCGKSVGTTSIEGVPFEKMDGAYVFDLSVKGLVGYEDGAPDENGSIRIRGEFAKDAQSATGDISVKTPRCESGTVTWKAKADPDVDRTGKNK